QSAFLLNASLKDNILFGTPYDEERYNEVLGVCCLHEDIEQLQGGDTTEIGERGVNLHQYLYHETLCLYTIGERGVNLSGGQKARVALARCLYKQPMVALLDDPLAAVDPAVASKLMKGIHSYLSQGCGTLVVMATHSVNILKHCDWVVDMDNGTMREVVHQTPEPFEEETVETIETIETVEGVTVSLDDTPVPATKESKADKAEGEGEREGEGDGALILAENRETGSVPLTVWKTFFRSLGSPLMNIIMILAYVGVQLASTSASFWLSYWTGDGLEKHTSAYLFGKGIM
ncbi:hypothetical protein KIPB_006630, partial [Kipferlia bialata]